MKIKGRIYIKFDINYLDIEAMRIKITWLWIIVVVAIIATIGIIIAWQTQPMSESFTNSEIIITDPVEGKETEIKKHPGAPVKNASEEVSHEFSNLTD